MVVIIIHTQLIIVKQNNMAYQNSIEIGVYYYIDENGNKVYDIEEMRREFETKLNQLTNQN